MSPKMIQRLRFIYGIVMSVLLAAAGCLLIVACWTIFRSPEGTFSRESVATAFGRIAVPVWLAVGGVVVGIVLSLTLPKETVKTRAAREEGTTLDRLTAAYDWQTLSPTRQAAVERERTLRRRLGWITVAVSVVLSIPVLVWILLPDSFGVADKNSEVTHAVAILAATFADVVVTCMITGLLSARSVHRELTVRKRAIGDRTATKRGTLEARRRLPWEIPAVLWSVRGGILAVAILFIALGVSNGGMRDVLGKAIRICTECIGLG